jgi:hypothetical protein
MCRTLLISALLWGVLLPRPVQAQEPARPEATATVDAAEQAKRAAAEAMERARRQAQGPWLRIRQASQLDRRGTAEPAPETPLPRRPGLLPATSADPALRRQAEPTGQTDAGIREYVERLPAEAASSPVSEAAAPPPASTTPTSAPTTTLAGPPDAEPPADLPVAPADVAPRSIVPPPAAAPGSLPVPDPGTAAPSPGMAPGPPTVGLSLPPGLTLPVPDGPLPPLARPAAAAPDVVPRVLNVVQPAMSAPLLAQLAGAPGLTAELRLNRDGSVAGVQLSGAVPRAAARALQSALAQWRFEPLPREMVHRVELVFDP